MTVSLPNEILLDELLGKLESLRSWLPRVISKLETLIRSGDDYALFRVNPIQFATEKGIAEAEGVDLHFDHPGRQSALKRLHFFFC